MNVWASENISSSSYANLFLDISIKISPFLVIFLLRVFNFSLLEGQKIRLWFDAGDVMPQCPDLPPPLGSKTLRIFAYEAQLCEVKRCHAALSLKFRKQGENSCLS